MYNAYVQDMIKEFGADNIFMLRKDYHGLYEDDYCYFTYYNNLTGEIFKDTWTTAGACPCYQSYECTSIWKAFKEGLVNTDKFFKILFDNEVKYLNGKSMEGNSFNMNNRDFLCSLNLKVNVSRGRKFKGSGYLVGYTTKSFRYATPHFHNHWYRNDDFGVTTTAYAKIYVPETNKIEYCTLAYVNIENGDKIFEEYKKYLLNNLEKSTPANLTADSNCEMGYRIDYGYLTFDKYLEKFHKNNIVISSDVSDAEVDKKNEKLNKLREEKMPGILKWVRECTDKTTEEEINKLAEHIFNKKYVK